VQGGLTNAKLGISGKKLLEPLQLQKLSQDVIVILLFGAAAFDERTAEILAKCEIGTYIGQLDKLKKFIQQRYIWVSRITSGSQANQLGQIAQNFVRDYLSENLGIDGVSIQRENYLPGVSHSDPTTNRPTSFDIVVSKGEKYVAIEVSFQVTTNSTIERKAGQARSRFEQIEIAGHKIAYVLDGAGNFQRENALRTICTHSHCTVAFSHAELEVLCQFIKTYL
jgi:DpnII restriction endonuclease